ncbi:hypothetical protein M0R45_025192 [Rubus argutus]|uniref:Uncharacterized protein n=1 Tax=Rubus argutus TaxID=59490 RepID=A0AAW1WXI9_RUBAR
MKNRKEERKQKLTVSSPHRRIATDVTDPAVVPSRSKSTPPPKLLPSRLSSLLAVALPEPDPHIAAVCNL